MKPLVAIITMPVTDFTTFTKVALQALDRSVTAASDASGRQQQPVEKYLACLASLQSETPTGLPVELLNHVYFSAMIVAGMDDTLPMLECASGMPFVTTPTKHRGVDLTVISGTLQQWRDAVVAGSQRPGVVREVFLQLMDCFRSQNLDVWGRYERQADGLLTWKKR